MPVSQNKSATYGALLLILCGMPAHADNEDVIAMCARIATVGDRILCLENALRQSSHEVAEIPVVEAVPVDETPVPEAMPAKEIAVVEVAPAIETAVTEATPVIKTAVVEAVPANDDIPAWLQTDQRTVRYGDVPFEAEIRPASMGSFFLRPVTGGASVRVRREK
jgi:hypothetical protein